MPGRYIDDRRHIGRAVEVLLNPPEERRLYWRRAWGSELLPAGISSITTTGCSAPTNPGIGHWALLSGRGAGGKEVDNEDDCAIVVECR